MEYKKDNLLMHTFSFFVSSIRYKLFRDSLYLYVKSCNQNRHWAGKQESRKKQNEEDENQNYTHTQNPAKKKKKNLYYLGGGDRL